ncbi:MAG: DUF1667 domain-containing protein [Treponema sp.]|nr:DUF1667 domain-containing protein [Treponema sp.]
MSSIVEHGSSVQQVSVHKQLTCITCPIGCRISVEMQNGEYVFSGNRCTKGADFARAEITSPMRSLTTTVRTVFPGMPVLPVRTKTEVPKNKIPSLIRELAKVVVTKKISIGEVIVPDILGTNCDIIATSDLEGDQGSGIGDQGKIVVCYRSVKFHDTLANNNSPIPDP